VQARALRGDAPRSSPPPAIRSGASAQSRQLGSLARCAGAGDPYAYPRHGRWQPIESANRLYVALLNLHDEAGMRDLRARFLDPLIASDPATLNASLRSVREATLQALEGRWD